MASSPHRVNDRGPTGKVNSDMRKTTPVIVRLMARVTMQDGPLATQCWISGTNSSRGGYTTIWEAGRSTMSHRVTYEHYVGVIPDGLQLDHLCRNRSCVHPWHVEPVTPRENMRRGRSPSMISHLSNTCKRGDRKSVV